MFKKGLSISLIALTLLLSMSTSVFAKTTNDNEKITNSDTMVSEKAPKAEKVKVKLNIDGKEVTAIHQEAPAPTVGTLDVGVPWTESYSTFTSSHFQNLIYTGIASVLAYKFGGANSFWYTLATSFAGNTYNEFTGDDYQDVHYYWQPSYYDPQLPYYIKQFIVHYKDSAQTQYVGTTTRYYYSSMTY